MRRRVSGRAREWAGGASFRSFAPTLWCHHPSPRARTHLALVLARVDEEHGRVGVLQVHLLHHQVPRQHLFHNTTPHAHGPKHPLQAPALPWQVSRYHLLPSGLGSGGVGGGGGGGSPHISVYFRGCLISGSSPICSLDNHRGRPARLTHCHTATPTPILPQEDTKQDTQSPLQSPTRPSSYRWLDVMPNTREW
jgi:hypothetical protein